MSLIIWSGKDRLIIVMADSVNSRIFDCGMSLIKLRHDVLLIRLEGFPDFHCDCGYGYLFNLRRCCVESGLGLSVDFTVRGDVRGASKCLRRAGLVV